jgi:3-methyladenine DNA glycosylase AlkD
VTGGGEPFPAAALADRLEGELREAGTPDRAVHEKAYLKSDLEFLGAGVPAIRSATKAVWRRIRADASHDDLVALVDALWALPIHERRFAAVELLRCGIDLLGAEDCALLARLIHESRTWALVDPLATEVMGELLLRSPQLSAVLDTWSTEDDLWLRRSALLALLPGLRRRVPGHSGMLVRYADALVAEREFFIRKAIGWVLRETGRRDPELVRDWLLRQAPAASGVTLREAVKYLPEPQRDAVLAAYRR